MYNVLEIHLPRRKENWHGEGMYRGIFTNNKKIIVAVRKAAGGFT
jgi:hypothetical protein